MEKAALQSNAADLENANQRLQEKLNEQISVKQIETKNLEMEKAALQSNAADLEKANQRLSEEIKDFQTGR